MPALLAALCTVYHGSDPQHLHMALDSLANQTRPAEHIVVVVDGPIGPDLEEVVTSFAAANDTVEIVRLPHNVGAGPASQAGVERISAEWIARLDSDDIATPQRFATQLAFIEQHPDVDVLGTAVAEFDSVPDVPANKQKIRRMPQTHDEIARYARINSPINNPSVMIRKSALDQAGGYQDIHFMEDYDLYARLLSRGARFYNLPEALTLFRVTDQQFSRRTSKGMLSAEVQMQKNLISYGLVNPPRAVANLVIRTAYRLLPTSLLRRAYRLLFHS